MSAIQLCCREGGQSIAGAVYLHDQGGTEPDEDVLEDAVSLSGVHSSEDVITVP
ncbi:hypothetical protein [Paenibacillus sp. NPDC055715]